jgi:ribosomal protein S18 acetylase RimI-like enzyme
MEIKRIKNYEASLVISLFDKYRMFYKQPTDPALAQTYIKERLDKNESVIFVAIVRDQGRNIPVGFTQLYPNYSSMRAHKNWTLNDLYVDNNYRKQGIGQLLIKAAMEFAKKDGASYVELSTAIDNFTAQRLYETIGFEKQEPDKDFFSYRIQVK